MHKTLGVALALLLAAATAASAGPMRDLARLVPATAVWPILILPGAARRELIRFDLELGALPIGPWVLFTELQYWSTHSWVEPIQSGIGPEYLGAPFAAIEGFAGWGRPDIAAGAMLLRDAKDGETVAGFLADRGYQRREIDGVPAYWLGDQDLGIDLTRRNADLYIGHLGQSTRVAVRERSLVAAHSWPPLEQALNPGDGLLGDAARAAIIDVAEAEGVGVPIQIRFLGPQAPRTVFTAESLEGNPERAAFRDALSALPPVPAYRDSALVLWLDGGLVRTGLLLSYGTAEGAEAALPWIEVLKNSPVSTLEPWSDLLTAATARTVAAGSGSVLLWTVPGEIKPTSNEPGVQIWPVEVALMFSPYFIIDWLTPTFGR